MLKLNSESPRKDFKLLNHTDQIEHNLSQFIKSDDEKWNLQSETSPTIHSLLYFEQEIQTDGGTSVSKTEFIENSSHLKKHIFTNQCNTYVPRTAESLSTFNDNSLLPSTVSSEVNDREYRDKPSTSFFNLEVVKLHNGFILPHPEICTFSSNYSNTTTVLEKNSTLHFPYNEGSDYMKNEQIDKNDNCIIKTHDINLSNNLVDLNYSQEKLFDTELVKYEENNNLFRRDTYLQDLDFVDKKSNEMTSVSLNSYSCNKCQSSNIEHNEGNKNKLATEFIPDTTKFLRFRNIRDSLPWDAPNTDSTNLLKTCLINNIYNGRNTIGDNIYQANPLSQNHTIPEGDDFIQMFQRRQIPTLELRFLENKSIFARNTTPDFNTVGFHAAMLIDAHKQFESEQDENEARKTECEILSMYPLHNKKYRRRY